MRTGEEEEEVEEDGEDGEGREKLVEKIKEGMSLGGMYGNTALWPLRLGSESHVNFNTCKSSSPIH